MNGYGYSVNTTGVNLYTTNWNEMIIVVGNESNKFVFHVSKIMLSNPKDVAKGLTQGYGNNSTSNYCVINVFENKIELVGLVIGGSNSACDIYTYYR